MPCRIGSSRSRGFTIVEFLMVVTITAILVVGLAAVVDVPATMIQQGASGESGVSDIDRGLAQLDADVRYAMTVRLTDAHTLDVDLQSGPTVRYAWDGVSGNALRRVLGAEDVSLVRGMRGLDFTVGTATYQSNVVSNVSTTTTSAVGASFNAFSLLPGYTFLGRTVFTVVETIGTQTISNTSYGGIYFSLPAGASADSFAEYVTLPLARFGTRDLLIDVYEGNTATRAPILSKRIGAGMIKNNEIPVARADVPVRLTGEMRLQAGHAYFLQVRSAGGGSAALLETRTLSNPLAVLDWGGGFLGSTNSGSSWSTLTGTLATSQVRFSLRTKREKDANPADTNNVFQTVTVTVPVKLHARFDVEDAGGSTRTFQTSIPLENNLALVNQ